MKKKLVIIIYFIFLIAQNIFSYNNIGFGRLLTIEIPEKNINKNILIGLRKTSIPVSAFSRLETNLLADIFLLPNITLKTSKYIDKKNALVFGFGGFCFVGDKLIGSIANSFANEVKDFHSYFKGFRTFAGFTHFFNKTDLHFNVKYLYAENNHIVDIIAGFRYLPSRYISFFIETGFMPVNNSWKAGIGFELFINKFRMSIGAIYNPINDPSFKLPIVPVVDIGIIF